MYHNDEIGVLKYHRDRHFHFPPLFFALRVFVFIRLNLKPHLDPNIDAFHSDLSLLDKNLDFNLFLEAYSFDHCLGLVRAVLKLSDRSYVLISIKLAVFRELTNSRVGQRTKRINVARNESKKH